MKKQNIHMSSLMAQMNAEAFDQVPVRTRNLRGTEDSQGDDGGVVRGDSEFEQEDMFRCGGKIPLRSGESHGIIDTPEKNGNLRTATGPRGHVRLTRPET